MRIFESCVEAMNEITREVFSRGQKVYDPTHQGTQVDKEEFDSMELVGYAYKIANPQNPEQAIEWAKNYFEKDHLEQDYAEDWFQEMLVGGLNPGEAHLKWRKAYWEKYGIEEDGKFAYTYSERMEGKLDHIIERLKDSTYRRAAYIPIWYAKDVERIGKRRVPCSLGYHLMVRKEGLEDALQLMYYQRSCDLANFYPLDLYRAVRLMQYVSEILDVKVGKLTHTISSLHAFKKDIPEDRRW